VGSLYKQRGRNGRAGRIWWIKYYRNGKPIRESTGTAKDSEARRMLKERDGRVATGQPILPHVDRIRCEEIARDLRAPLSNDGLARPGRSRGPDRPSGPLLRGAARRHDRPADITAYVAKRQSEDASNGTVNRDLAILNKMLRLAYENGKLLRLPLIPKLREAAPRSGFFERSQCEAVRKHLRPDLQVAVTIAYTYGWRMRSEVLALELRHLDLDTATLRLDPGMTKNDEGRVVYLTQELKQMLAAQVDRVRCLERALGRIIPHLFPYLRGTRWRGARILELRKAWATACKRAGVPGMLRHDFRRTAVRNMVNAGVPERVAMHITGHKTRSVFDRYHIVSPADLRAAAARLTGITTGITAGPGDGNDSQVAGSIGEPWWDRTTDPLLKRPPDDTGSRGNPAT
jgi:integrase